MGNKVQDNSGLAQEVDGILLRDLFGEMFRDKTHVPPARSLNVRLNILTTAKQITLYHVENAVS